MLHCPYCRAPLMETDAEDSRCSSCGRELPDAGSTVAGEHEGAASAGRTMPIDEWTGGHEEGGGTMQFEEGLAAHESGRTMSIGDPPEAAAADDPGRTINMDVFEPGSTADHVPSIGFPTMNLDEGIGGIPSGGTVQLPDEGLQVPPDDSGLRTISMSGEELAEDLSLKTFDMSEATGLGGRTIADISQSALFDDIDAQIAGDSHGGSRSGSAVTPPTDLPSSGSARPSDESGAGSGLKDLSDATGETYISDEWADPGIDKTISTPEAFEKHVEQIVKTIWMEAASEKPGTSLKGREPKRAVKPATGTPLVIKPRVLRRAEDSIPGEQAEYELLKVLGEGGMGIVYDARQTSIDRGVALKMLKGGAAGDDKQRQKFLAEAVVTGDLDHPNIVPIYDVGTNHLGHLFYSMKKVQGTPWNKLVGKKSQAENLEILMKVADAVAFAHARGVVHRDLKPENVMLGEYGEVLVMDWGLAQSTSAFRKRSSITEATGMGGTPAYMAPEMATGPLAHIGPLADVYLLGAILYEIVTGRPPHGGKNAMMCLMSAAKNEIVPTDKTGELVDIARTALSTNPAHRYQSVIEFQGAIRDYLSHAESIALSTRAVEDMQQAARTDEYQDFSRAMFGFQEALELWSGNTRAGEALAEVRLAYATSALRKGDYDLGASLLDAGDPSHAPLVGRILQARQERERRQQRLKVMRQFAIGLVAVVLLVVSGAAILIYGEQQKAESERLKAVASAEDAEAQRKIAVANEIKAVENEKRAVASEKEAVAAAEEERLAKIDTEKQRIIAVANERKAVAAAEAEKNAKEAEEYEAYVARIGLASAKIKENAFETALTLLKACRPANGGKDLRNWEWGRLMHLCSLHEDRFDLKAPVDAAAMSPDGRRFIAGTYDSHARIIDIATRQTVVDILHKGLYVHAVAWSPDARFVATGGSVLGKNYAAGDNLNLWDAATGQLLRNLPGHADAVLSIRFSKDGSKLLTSSYDKSARLFDVASGRQLQAFEGHTWTVWSAAFSPDETHIVTASSDGTARVWALDGTAQPPFTGHRGPVYAAAFSPDGTSVVTGGHDKRVLVWKPTEVQPYDFEQIVANASAGQTQPLPTASYAAFEGHNAPVRSVSFDHDGRMILSSAQDNTCKLWDVESRQPVKTLRGHDQLVRAALFVPDGRGVLTASHDGQVMLWSIPGREEFRVLAGKILEGHRDEVLAASFSKDGQSIVTAGRDRTARTWDLSSGSVRNTLQEGHDFLASAAMFFPGGQQMLTAAIDGTVRIWNVDTGTEASRLDNTGQRAAVALSADGKFIITGGGQAPGADGQTAWKIQVWNAETAQHVRDLVGHAAEVSALAFTADGQTVVSGDSGGDVVVWDFPAGTVRHRMAGHNQLITAIATLPGGLRALVASADSTVGQWNLATGRELPHLNLKHPQAVLSLDLSPDGRLAATACNDGKVRLWNVESAEVVLTLQGAGRVESVRISPDGQRVAGVDSANRAVHLWDIRTGTEVPGGKDKTELPFLKADRVVWSLAFVPNARPDAAAYMVTIGGTEGRLWSVAAKELMDYTPHSVVASAGFSPDGELVVTGSWDWSARIWNARTGKALRKLEGHASNINSAQFSPDGSTVLTASDDRSARLWDVKSGNLLKTLDGHTGAVLYAVFSFDGATIVTASSDRNARVWDAKSGQMLRVLESVLDGDTLKKGHRWGVRCVAIDREGRRVVTGSDDTSAVVWNVATGEMLQRLSGHTAPVLSVAFSPDGQRVLTGSADNNAKLWDAAKGTEILTLDGHAREVTSVSFSPDGQLVLTGSRDGTARVWLSTEWQNKGAPVAGK